MMLRYWSKVFYAFLLVLISVGFNYAQDINDTTTVIWVLIENVQPKTDSSISMQHAKMMRQHMDYLSKIHSEEKMLASISFQGGGGLMFFKSEIDSIKSWLEEDPAIESGMFKLNYLTFNSEKGNICLSDKNSELGNVEVQFITFSSPKDPGMRERIEKKRNKVLSENISSENTLCFGTIEENNSYAVIRKLTPGFEDKIETGKTINSGVKKDIYTAWAPLAAFCD